MTLLATVGIIYGAITIIVAFVNTSGWVMNRDLFEEDASAFARRAVRAHIWPLMLLNTLRQMKEDAK